jgi:hypothetical protein
MNKRLEKLNIAGSSVDYAVNPVLSLHFSTSSLGLTAQGNTLLTKASMSYLRIVLDRFFLTRKPMETMLTHLQRVLSAVSESLRHYVQRAHGSVVSVLFA